MAQRRVAAGIDVRQHLIRRCRPEEARVAGRSPELGGALDEHDRRAVPSGACGGGEAGHAATDDGEIALPHRRVHWSTAGSQ